MKKLVYVLACLMFISCVFKNKPSENNDIVSWDVAVESVSALLDSAVLEHAQGGNLLIVDFATGETLLDYCVGRVGDSLTRDVKAEGIEPGILVGPMIMAGLFDDPEITGSVTRVAGPRKRVYFDYGSTIVGDEFSKHPRDSVAAIVAMQEGLPVALCWLAENYYAYRRDSLRNRIFRLFTDVEEMNIEASKDVINIGRIRMEDSNAVAKHRPPNIKARKFYMMAMGLGFKVAPKDILSFYLNVFRERMSEPFGLSYLLPCRGGYYIIDSSETHRLDSMALKRLVEAAQKERPAVIWHWGGCGSSVPCIDNPELCNSCFVGYYATGGDTPWYRDGEGKFAAMITLYGSDVSERSVEKLLRSVGDKIVQCDPKKSLD